MSISKLIVKLWNNRKSGHTKKKIYQCVNLVVANIFKWPTEQSIRFEGRSHINTNSFQLQGFEQCCNWWKISSSTCIDGRVRVVLPSMEGFDQYCHWWRVWAVLSSMEGFEQCCHHRDETITYSRKRPVKQLTPFNNANPCYLSMTKRHAPCTITSNVQYFVEQIFHGRTVTWVSLRSLVD